MKLFLLQILLNIIISSCSKDGSDGSSKNWPTSYEELHHDNKEDSNNNNGVGIISTCIDLCVADDYIVRSNVVSMTHTYAYMPKLAKT